MSAERKAVMNSQVHDAQRKVRVVISKRKKEATLYKAYVEARGEDHSSRQFSARNEAPLEHTRGDPNGIEGGEEHVQ